MGRQHGISHTSIGLGVCVVSATPSRSGAVTRKARSTRSAAGCTSGARFVVHDHLQQFPLSRARDTENAREWKGSWNAEGSGPKWTFFDGH